MLLYSNNMMAELIGLSAAVRLGDPSSDLAAAGALELAQMVVEALTRQAQPPGQTRRRVGLDELLENAAPQGLQHRGGSLGPLDDLERRAGVGLRARPRPGEPIESLGVADVARPLSPQQAREVRRLLAARDYDGVIDRLDVRDDARDLGVDPWNRRELPRPIRLVMRPADPGGAMPVPFGGHPERRSGPRVRRCARPTARRHGHVPRYRLRIGPYASTRRSRICRLTASRSCSRTLRYRPR